MDGHDHKTTATSAGHEGHEVHLCHRCGWPFPNPHPSAKHRRAHKKVCGTIEGYKSIHSEYHGDHLAVSDDDHASDDDEHHTPSPNIIKKNAESSGRVVEKSPKSEEDVFSDAVTDFSDSGISPKLEERFESVGEFGKSLEQKSVEGDLYGSGVLKVEEATDTTEKSNDVRSEEISEPGPLANGNNQPGNVIPITDTAAKMVSVGLINDSLPEHGVGGSVQGEMIPEQEADIQVQDHGSASVPLDLEEGIVLDQTIAARENQDELCDKLVSEVAKHDPSPPSESLQNVDASEGINSVVHSAERSTFTESVEVSLVDETHQSVGAFVGVKEDSHSTENIESIESVGENVLPQESLLSMSSVKSNESRKTLDVTEHSEVICMVSSIDKEEMPEGGSLDGGQTAGNFNANEGEKSYVNGNGNLESKNLNSVDAVSALGSTDNALECEDAITTMTKKGVDHCGENIISAVLESGNEKGEGASVEVEVIPDSTMPSEKPTDFPSSCAADSDAKSLQKLSENNSSSPEFRDDGFEKSIQGHDADKVIEVLQSVGSAGEGLKESHELGGALDKNSLPTSSWKHTVSPVTAELPSNIHVAKNVIESLDVAETVSKLKDDIKVIASGVTTEHSISEESMSRHSVSGLVSGDASSDREDAEASEFIIPTEITAKDHESNVVTREISESPTPSVQEAFPTSKCLNVTSPDVEQTYLSDDLSTLKPVDIISSAEHTFDGKALTSDECSATSDAPTVQQPVTSPSDVQDFHGTSATVDDNTLVNVEDVTSIHANSVQTEVDDKPTKQTDGASAIDVSGSLTSRSDSLEANCGSVVSDALETNSQKLNTPTEEGHPEKSDTFEPPSFMTLVQSGSEREKVTAAAEIETVQNNQQQKSDALQAGWFPSLTNVVNESEGRKKNEEIIAKVTNWSPVKQQHGPLKSLLNEVKSPNTKQVPAANQKVEAEAKDDNAGVTASVGSVLTSETHTTNDQDPKKHVEEWNSPARYPIEIKKEKKKGRPFWVPFVCCSTAHS
ncbi:hypothetical protein C2S52_014909 [Perilla frutescens var. hirtella]|nr:hypothetical protein C2S52_014909 [Perilla frutescens var. hirtella]